MKNKHELSMEICAILAEIEHIRNSANCNEHLSEYLTHKCGAFLWVLDDEIPEHIIEWLERLEMDDLIP